MSEVASETKTLEGLVNVNGELLNVQYSFDEEDPGLINCTTATGREFSTHYKSLVTDL